MRPIVVLCGVLILVLGALLHRGSFTEPQGRQEAPATPPGNDSETGSTPHRPARPRLPEGIPAKVATVLEHIDNDHQAPDGYEGGRTFHNFGRANEERLPLKDKEGNAISYQEWDVHPKIHNVNRGAERLVTGSDGSAYYTSDHYRTFTKIR
jgi:guanyl-specific ribonuclease Sa